MKLDPEVALSAHWVEQPLGLDFDYAELLIKYLAKKIFPCLRIICRHYLLAIQYLWRIKHY
ncbi:MAG: hypothetical protein DCE90_02315 [Pseudanabaena sp.]|nr:MAG: hypothetical protein DCE90_02315 [Pseudanabaena sp.]